MLHKALIALPFILLISCDPAPEGEGSYRQEKKIKKVLAALNPKNPDQELPDGYYLMRMGENSHYIITGTDSHKRGGTIGVLFPDGTIFTHYGHVCGPGPMPLSFPGDTKEEVIEAIKNPSGH